MLYVFQDDGNNDYLTLLQLYNLENPEIGYVQHA